VLICDYHSDVDECETNTANCSTNATCTNTEPGFTCECKPGYEGDGFTCDGKPVSAYLYYTSFGIMHRKVVLMG